MSFSVLVLGVAILASYARGGRLKRFADADLGWLWLLLAGLGLQVVVVAAAGNLPDTVGTVLLLASQVPIVAWVLLHGDRPGMLIILAGLLMNATVIVANGAMPVHPQAIGAIGRSDQAPSPGKHEVLSDETHLSWLADRYPLSPLRTVISLGDLVLAAGLVPLVHHLMTTRAEQPATTRAEEPATTRAEEPATTWTSGQPPH